MTIKTSLILGGARSGKTSFAEQLAKDTNKSVVYIATAKVLDNEIQQRVLQHQQTRPSHWITVEEPIKLASVISKWASPDHVILIDCLTMWITNLLTKENDAQMKDEIAQLLSIIPNATGDLIFVSNEVGMGIIPMGELTRRYVDEAGKLHQELAQHVNQVTLVVAGLPLSIKDSK